MRTVLPSRGERDRICAASRPLHLHDVITRWREVSASHIRRCCTRVCRRHMALVASRCRRRRAPARCRRSVACQLHTVAVALVPSPTLRLRCRPFCLHHPGEQRGSLMRTSTRCTRIRSDSRLPTCTASDGRCRRRHMTDPPDTLLRSYTNSDWQAAGSCSRAAELDTNRQQRTRVDRELVAWPRSILDSARESVHQITVKSWRCYAMVLHIGGKQSRVVHDKHPHRTPRPPLRSSGLTAGIALPSALRASRLAAMRP